jgi:hypothetical protein
MSAPPDPTCPVCESADLLLTPRGYAGRTDTPHQYLTCQSCGQVIYEIMSVSQREIRLHRYEANGLFAREGVTYRIRRILKVGFDEFLLYLRVVEAERPAAEDEELDPPAEEAEQEPAGSPDEARL